MDDRQARRTRRRAPLLVIAVVAMLGAGVPSSTRADSVSDAQQQVQNAQNQLNQTQGQLNGAQAQSARTGSIIANLQAQLSQYADQETQLKAVVAKLTQDVTDQQAKVDAAQQELDRIKADLDAAQAHLTDARARLLADRTRLADQLRQIYENPPTSTINALLSSDNFDEFYQKFLDERRVADTEQQYVDLVNAEAAQVTADVARITADKQQQATALAAQQATQKQLEDTKAAKVEAQNELDQVIASDQQTLAQNEQAQHEIAAEIQQDQAALMQSQQAVAAAKTKEQQAIAAAAAAHAGGGLAGYGGTGRFGWPEPAYDISQGFGCTPYAFEPYDPNCPSRHFHSGIDIADPWGIPVEASDNGVVHIYVSSYGYGLHIIEAHGNGYSTVYGHLSSFAVADGTYVAKGTVIGYEGSTGNSSGPHLHFEIRQGQTPVNPLAFLS